MNVKDMVKKFSRWFNCDFLCNKKTIKKQMLKYVSCHKNDMKVLLVEETLIYNASGAAQKWFSEC